MSFTFGFDTSPAVGDVVKTPLKKAQELYYNLAATPPQTWPVEAECACFDTKQAEKTCPNCGIKPIKKFVLPHSQIPQLINSMQEDDKADLFTSDLIPGEYEGGFKLWECSRDLLSTLNSMLAANQVVISDTAVLEVGCGAALPGIFSLKQGCKHLTLHDFNEEVLRWLTMPGLYLNDLGHPVEIGHVRFFSGDWQTTNDLMKYMREKESYLPTEGFDLILSADSLYSCDSMPRLYQLIVDQLCRPTGMALVAAKSYYFGVGGSVALFRDIVQKGGLLECSVLRTIEDGSSNRREILLLKWATALSD